MLSRRLATVDLHLSDGNFDAWGPVFVRAFYALDMVFSRLHRHVGRDFDLYASSMAIYALQNAFVGFPAITDSRRRGWNEVTAMLLDHADATRRIGTASIGAVADPALQCALWFIVGGGVVGACATAYVSLREFVHSDNRDTIVALDLLAGVFARLVDDHGCPRQVSAPAVWVWIVCC